MEYAEWEKRLPGELSAAKDRIKSGNVDFGGEIQDFVKPYVTPSSKILDIGAGIVTSLGTNIGRSTLDITAVDVLADGYNELLETYNLAFPIKTLQGTFEKIVDQFGENVFDFVYSNNSLDQCVRPIHALWNMIRACKPNGYIFIKVYENEATRNNYKGLCQWDFCILNGKLLMNGMNVLETVACSTIQLKKEQENGLTAITWVMKKGSF